MSHPTIYQRPVFEMARRQWVQDLQRLFWDEPEVIRRLYEILDRSFAQVVGRAERLGISNRNAALSIGIQRVRDTKGTGGLFP
jgi:glutamate dehydrogenase (NAD(P)+)